MFVCAMVGFTTVFAQEKEYEVAVVGFYNLENLFDVDTSMHTIYVDKLNAGEADYMLAETYNSASYYKSEWISFYENLRISKSKTDYSLLPKVPVSALQYYKPKKKEYESREGQSISKAEFNSLVESDDRWLSKQEYKDLIEGKEYIEVNTTEVVAKVRDAENTPEGARQYTDELYNDKLDKLAEVIVTLGESYSPDGAALLGLAEIENEQVLIDLAATKKLESRGYEVIHHDCMYSRGVDVALYYQAKYFEVTTTHTLQIAIFNDNNESNRYYTRDILWVEGKLLGETVHVFVNHWPSRRGGEAKSGKNRERGAQAVKDVVDQLMKEDPNTQIIVMGDFNDDPSNNSVLGIMGAAKKVEDVKTGGMFNPLYQDYKKGYGSLAYRGSWNLFDQVLVSSSFVDERSSQWKIQDAEVVYNQDWINRFGGYEGGPNRSFGGNYYLAGYSDHLPSVVYLKRVKQSDRDGDGVIDKNDACPDVKGLPNMKGCPDSDGDGIEDPLDKCPQEAGPADNQGCPYSDQDNDGVFDKDDECPQTEGLKSNKGCPELKEEVKAAVQAVFDNLIFDTGKSTIKSSSDDELVDLAEILIANPELVLKISGHTDNVGEKEDNLQLSKDRSFAVKERLISLGVSSDRMNALFFGETKAVATNDTDEGRQINRRVEFDVKAK